MWTFKFQEFSGQYKNFTCMARAYFEFLINLMNLKIAKDTMHRAAISVEKRLAVTLRYLAMGDLYTTLQYLFKIMKQSAKLFQKPTTSANSSKASDLSVFVIILGMCSIPGHGLSLVQLYECSMNTHLLFHPTENYKMQRKGI